GAREGGGGQVEAVRRRGAGLRGWERVEDVQRLERGDAARRARRKRELEVAVAANERCGPAYLVAGQVLLGDQPTAAHHLVGDGLRDRAAIERVGPLLRDEDQALGQIAI